MSRPSNPCDGCCRSRHATAYDEDAITPAERDNATFQILRLDPLSLHTQPDISKVQDLPRLRKVLQDNVRRVPDLEQQKLFTLKATKAALAEQKFSSHTYGHGHNHSRRLQLSAQGTLNAISNLIQSTRYAGF